ncbi:MAG: FAD-dependent oxidoreductase [Desulfobacteraceae bacterium]|nr:MAG: FAD-dependent oxidoreductase [Desulfobacteraceae bacterium]
MLENLFSPFQIKSCHLNSRIVMTPLASFLIEDDGSVTDKTIEHYRKRASGGPAMVIVEAHAVAPEGVVSNHQARIYDDRFLDGIYKIATVIRSEGSVPAIQLHHAGRQTSIKVIKRKPLAPSNIPCPTIKGEVEALSIEGIQQMVAKFGEAAERALQAGFQLIEIHGAHGYLVNQFLSRFSNIREDEYGGSLKGRTRFAEEIVREIRSKVGPDFPISFKISAQEFVPDGLTTDESVEILREIIPCGVDIVQVSAGNDATPEWICQPMFMEKACLSDSAARIRTELNVPVMTVGRINDPVVADDIIREGKADLVCMGRGLLADPEMPKKAREGRLDDIRICIACNTCMESIFRRGRVECLVNPSLGREQQMFIQPAEKSKKVMVIGGGPGGLEAAWVAASRGHDVELYEKQSQLGGQLNMGSLTKYKKELLTLIRYQTRQAEKFGVKLHLDTEATADLVRRVKPDVVILSTGSTPVKPRIPGIEKSIVKMLPSVLNGAKPPTKKTVILGGGATGCEVAHYLGDYQCEVTVIEQLPKVAEQLESITRKVLLKELRERRVRILTSCRLSRIEDKGVFVTDQEGNETFLEADAVVIAIGNRPDNALYDSILSMGLPVHRVGDCVEPRSAKTAILEGAIAGREI